MTAAIWGFVLSNAMTAEATLVAATEEHDELHQVHGLRLGSPLTVEQATRTAGTVEQSVTEVGDVVTVERI